MTRPPDSTPADRAKHGFTLLEVLAAVAILGLWYVVITHSSVLALYTEGENLRRLEAGAIADIRLAEIESVVQAVGISEIEDTDSEEGDYRVRVEVLPFSMGGAATAASAVDVQQPDLRAMLTSEMLGAVMHLRTLRVAVGWLEPDGPRIVSRTSFAFDEEAYIAQLEEAATRNRGRSGEGPVDRTQ